MIQKLKKLLLLICVFSAHTIYAQTTTISGTVTDSSNSMPLPGVNVVEKGTMNGATTDFDGNYTIQVSDKNAVLQFSFLGYLESEISVSGQTVINAALEESSEALDEIVITALGIKKSTKAVGYSLTQLKGEEISNVKTTNAINSLQGKIAGVNITTNATGAAGSSRVVIRGASSLSGNNQPLYVVDGIPIGNNNNGAAGEWGGNDGGDGISSINPDEIASISVLKGGAASALYGSRASGGVVLITTKTGKNQKGLGVELNSSFTFDKINTSLNEFQTQYGQGKFGLKPVSGSDAKAIGTNAWGPRLDGSSVPQWDGVSRPYSYVGNNQENFYNTGVTKINTIALSSSTDNSSFRFAVSDLGNEDLTPNASLDRKTISLNAGTVVADKLTANVNVKYIIEEANNRPNLSDAPGNANYMTQLLAPNVSVSSMNPGMNEDGSEAIVTDNVFITNPYWAANKFKKKDKKNRIIASTSLRYDVNDWLYVSARAGLDHYNIRRTNLTPYGTGFFALGAITENNISYTQIDADLILGADKDITDKISVNALVGTNTNHVQNEDIGLSGQQFIVPTLADFGNTTNQSASRGFGEREISSIYGSFEVSYDDYLYLTYTGRNDWFSTLSFPGKETPNDDFYTSLSGSLIVSELIELPEAINFFKLRAGYSNVAGGAQDPYQLGLTYQIVGQGHLGQPLGNITNTSVPNQNLVAFNKSEVEIGLDARLFDNRLALDLAYYKNETTNDIVPVAASVFSGYSSAIANIGVVENKGFEFLISAKPIVTDDFSWNTSFNGSHNTGTVISTNESGGDISVGQPRSLNIAVTQIVGEDYGTLFGTAYARDDSGAIIYDTSSGVPIAQQAASRKILGTGVAPLTLGFSNSFQYKDFNMSFLIDGKFGGQVFSGTNAAARGFGLHQDTNPAGGRENGLVVSGTDTSGSSFTTTVSQADMETYFAPVGIYGIAEASVYDSDYIKFRQLSIGYSLPSKYLDKTALSSVNISFIATNLFYLMTTAPNIDPEAGFNVGNGQGLEWFGVPPTRNYGFNLNIKF